jgi:riboflavin synthase alpha subunit
MVYARVGLLRTLPESDPRDVQRAILTSELQRLRLESGSTVNLEGDMLGRFVVHYLKRVRNDV